MVLVRWDVAYVSVLRTNLWSQPSQFPAQRNTRIASSCRRVLSHQTNPTTRRMTTQTLLRSDSKSALNKAPDLHCVLSGQLKRAALWPQSCHANNSGMSIITALQMRWHIITVPDLSERLPANSGNNARCTRPFSASHLSARVTHRRPHDKVTAGSCPPACRSS